MESHLNLQPVEWPATEKGLQSGEQKPETAVEIERDYSLD